MWFSVVLVSGGDFCNIRAPLRVEAESFPALDEQVRSSFGIEKDANLVITYCGVVLKKLPPRNGAPLFASIVAQRARKPTSKLDNVASKMRPEIQEAIQFMQKILRSPLREKLKLLATQILNKRYTLFPELCEQDKYAARIASNLELFLQSINPKIMRDHELISSLAIEIYKEAKTKLNIQLSNQSSNVRSIPANQSSSQGGSSQMSSFINQITGNQNQNQPITQDLLQQALLAASQNMNQSGQSTLNQPNLPQAANEVVSEIAALAEAVEKGFGVVQKQFREMGIQFDETEARRILQENGGNVQATINQLLN